MSKTKGKNKKKKSEPKPTKKELKAVLKAKEEELKEEVRATRMGHDDWVAYAKQLLNKMFTTWKQADIWIKGIHKSGQETAMVTSPLGRVRHLWAYLQGDYSSKSAMDRRGPNSIIQGMSSDIGAISARCVEDKVWEYSQRLGIQFDFFQTTAVHDSLCFECDYHHMPFCMYLVEHSMTSLSMDYLKEVFGQTTPVPLQIELEVGGNEAELEAWNFREENFIHLIEQSGRQQDIPEEEIKHTLVKARKIMAIRRKELKTNPYKMLISDKQLIEQHSKPKDKKSRTNKSRKKRKK